MGMHWIYRYLGISKLLSKLLTTGEKRPFMIDSIGIRHGS